jgi:hypothetical protein
LAQNGPIVLASIFRDSTSYLDRYFAQVEALREHLDVRLALCEGDSLDDTYRQLKRQASKDDLVMWRDHGGPKFGSVDHVQRWAQIAWVCNELLRAIRHSFPGLPLVYVESDLIWEPETPLTLLADLEHVPAVAPMSMHQGRFYDLWGHRGLDGVRFRPHPPYHDDLAHAEGLVEISSAGSCVVMRPEVAAVAEFGDNDCIVGLGRSIRHNGGGLYLDPRVAVHHP